MPDLKPESSRLDPSTDFADLVDLKQSLPSPSGQYVLSAYCFPPEDGASAIVLRISDARGTHLDSFVTQQSSKQNWALGWHPGEDTVVLQTGTVTTVYSIASGGAIHLMECPQPEYGETGLGLIETKYPHLEAKKPEPSGRPGGDSAEAEDAARAWRRRSFPVASTLGHPRRLARCRD